MTRFFGFSILSAFPSGLGIEPMDLERINVSLAGAGPEEILAWALKTFPY